MGRVEGDVMAAAPGTFMGTIMVRSHENHMTLLRPHENHMTLLRPHKNHVTLEWGHMIIM